MKTPTRKITKAWIEWAKQRDACSDVMRRLRPGMPLTSELIVNNYSWLHNKLWDDGLKYPYFCSCVICRRSDRNRQQTIAALNRISREVEIVDVDR